MVNRKMAIFAGAFLLFVGLIGLVIVSVVYAVAQMIGNKNAVVIDAGSTSSKLSLYEWRDDPFRTNGEVKQVNESKVEPGISNYISQPFEAYNKLEKPLQALVENIPMEKHKNIPVYLAATAGMRLALLEDPLGSMDLFEALRRGLMHSGLQVENSNERIRLLSGNEEGLFGWVSVNNALDLVTVSNQVDPFDTVGSLDLGGASTQIAFVAAAAPKTMATSIDFSTLRLFGKTYQVYTHSFLCYGKNEFEKRVMGSIIVNSNPSAVNPEIKNPCFPNGYKSPEKPASKIFKGPCMSGSYAQKVFTDMLQKPQTLENYTFAGTGQPDECLKVIQKQFQTGTCTMQPCSFNNVYQPDVRGHFRAYSGFAYAMKFLFPNKTTGFTKMEVLDAVKKFCSKTWDQIKQELSAKELSFASKYCFDGLFIVTLLENYRFKSDESWRTITFGAKIEGHPISWALGYMLDQSGFLPPESPKINLPMAAFIPLAILFVVILLVGIIVLVLTLCRKESDNEK